MTINDSIGLTGAGTIAINHIGTGSAGEVTTVNGDIGAKVISINQNTANASLQLNGAGTNFGGPVNLTAGKLILGSATALGGNGSTTGTGGTLTISGGTSLDSGTANLVLTTVNAVAVNGNFTFTGTNNMTLGTGAVTLGAANTSITATANTLRINGAIGQTTAGSNLTKLGAGTVILAAANTYSGATNVTGGNLTIGGAVGSSISNSSSVSLTGGTAVVLDYTTVGDAATNKINDSATVTISAVGLPNASGNSGLQLLGNSAGNSTETIGTLAFGAGASVVGVTQANASRVTSLTATNGLTRSSFGTALLRGSSLGGQATAVGQIILGSLTGLVQVGNTTSTTGAAGTTKDLTIVPYLIGDTASGGLGSASSGSFVTYDTFGRGFRVLAAAEQNQLTAATDTFANTNVSYSPTVANSVLTLDATNRTWNSLQIGRSGTFVSRTLTGGGGTLAITSGALQTGDQTAGDATVINGFSKITFGNNATVSNLANEAVIFVNGSSGGAAAPLTIGSPIDVTQGGGLTKAGAGTLNLTAANLYTGVTTINQGTINVGGGTAAGDLGSSSGVTLNGASGLTFNRSNSFSYTNAITGSGSTGGSTVTQAGSGALTLGAISGVQTVTQSASTGALTTGNISNAGTITIASSAGATLGNVTTATTVTHSSGAGALTTGTITGIGTLTDNSTTGTTAAPSTTINQSGSGLTIGTITGATGSVVTLKGDGTDSTTISTVSGTGTLVVNGASGSNVTINSGNVAGLTFDIKGGTTTFTPNSGATTSSNFLIEGGTFIVVNAARFQLAQANQTFNMTGGTVDLTAVSSFGLRVGSANGATATGAAAVTATQSGGSLTNNLFNMGGSDTTLVNSPTYALSGGTFTDTNTGTTAFVLGADTAGVGSTTFTLSGTGKLSVAGTISGGQGAGAKQAFVFSGGTLAVGTLNATNLTSTAGTAVVLNTTNTLTNAGGTLAPGDIGTGGKTIITGNYNVTSSNASYAVDLGSATAATAFQSGAAFYDQTTVSGSTTLGGKLNLSLINAYTPASNGTTLHNILVGSASGVTGTFINQQTATGGNSRVVFADGLSSMLVAINNTASAATTGGLTSVGARTVAVGNYQAGNTYSGAGTTWDTANAGAWTNFDPGATATPATQASGAIAQFADGTASTGAIGVSLNSARNIQGIQFSSASSSRAYTISQGGSGAIILDNTGNSASATIADTSTSGTANAINVPITLNSNLAASVTNAANTLTIGGVISGNNTLTKTGAGTLVLSGNNTYTGNTTISTGTLQLGAGSTTGKLATTAAVVNNGTFTINRSDAVAQGTDFSSAAITGTGAFVQAGGGTTTLNAANTYTGATTISAGTLSVGTIGNGGVAGNLGQATNVAANLVFDGGTLQYTGSTATSDRAFTINAGKTASIKTANDLTLAGATGTATNGALTKLGAGTMTLTGVNTYTGLTTISAGTLALGASGSIASSSGVNLGTVGSQGTLDLTAKSSFTFGTGQTLGGYGTVNIGSGNTVTVNGTFAPGNSTGIATVTGNLALGSSSVSNFDIAGRSGGTPVAGADYDKALVSGMVTFSGTLNLVTTVTGLVAGDSFHLFDSATYAGHFTSVVMTGTYVPSLVYNGTDAWTGVDLTSNLQFSFTETDGYLLVAAIPEPSTYAALAGALALVGAIVYRRRRSS
jgi:autotransporter-associated beta strand protein